MTEVNRTALHRMDVSLRHYCRHPKCRSKLPKAVDTDRAAFCSRACYVDFYRRHCLVCEADMPAAGLKRGRTYKAAYCSDRCGEEARRNPEAYAVPGVFAGAIEGADVSPIGMTGEIAQKPNEIGPEISRLSPSTPAEGWRGPKVAPQQRWTWGESSAGAWVLRDGRGDIRARLELQSDRWRVTSPWAIPATESKNLGAIKTAAVSLALAALPLDNATQARVRAAERELDAGG